MDVYRQDFNMMPSFYWAAHDAQNGPGRVGLAELLHVEGLYSLWDHLTASIPGLLIDNCASGGRRLDIELVSRAVTLWRSARSQVPRNTWACNESAAFCHSYMYSYGLDSSLPLSRVSQHVDRTSSGATSPPRRGSRTASATGCRSTASAR